MLNYFWVVLLVKDFFSVAIQANKPEDIIICLFSSESYKRAGNFTFIRKDAISVCTLTGIPIFLILIDVLIDVM